MACSDREVEFARDVARLCIARFNALPKTGKPQNNEWTVLGGIVQRDARNPAEGCSVSAQHHGDAGDEELTWAGTKTEGGRQDYTDRTAEIRGSGRSENKLCCVQNGGGAFKNHGTVEKPNEAVSSHLDQVKNKYGSETSDDCSRPADLTVVALGTGSKCLGTSRWCSKGTLVHDAHAEVVAKRSFQLYLLDQMEAAYLERESVFRLVSKDELDSRRVPVQHSEPPMSTDVDLCVREESREAKSQSTRHNCRIAQGKEGTANHVGDRSPCSDEAGSGSMNVTPSKAVRTNLTTLNNASSSSIEQKLVLANGVSFHMFISHTPCGDCSIFPKDEHANDDSTGHGDIVVGRLPNLTPDKVGGSLKENADITSDISSLIDCQVQVSNCGVLNLDIADEKNDLPGTGKLQNREIGAEDAVREPSHKKFKPNVDLLNISTKASNNGNLSDTQEKTNRHSTVSLATTGLRENTEPSNDATELGSVRHYNDIHRTGAKCVSGETEDLHLPGSLYHKTGPLRTKPGRGDPTLSHCCSDKLVKWSVLGLQGSLLSAFCETPIHLASLIIGSCPFNYEAMDRGLFSRFKDQLLKYDSTSPLFKLSRVKILKCDVPFDQSRSETQRRLGTTSVTACPSSISWNPGYGERGSRVIVNGRKLGVTKKALGTVKSQVSLCRYQIMANVVKLHGIRQQTARCVGDSSDVSTKDVLQQWRSESDPRDHDQDNCNVSYRELKSLSLAYNTAWKLLRETVLTNWTVKPDDLQNFVL